MQQARSHRYGLAARAVALFWPICIKITCRPYRFFQPWARGPIYPQVGPQNQVQNKNLLLKDIKDCPTGNLYLELNGLFKVVFFFEIQ